MNSHKTTANYPQHLWKTLGTLAYGGDYNPEQWPAETLDEDIKLMQEYGVNLVSLGIFSWFHLEPKPGLYNFSTLDRYMDKLASAGISVDLATGTASPPAWMAELYPETLPVNCYGMRMKFGSRQHYSPSSQRYRESCAGLVEALSRHYAGHPALKLWHCNNEYGAHVCESFDEESIARFQAWLANKYGDIESLNHRWTTSFWSQRYDSFAQISAPNLLPTFTNPAHAVDWREFSSDQLLECYLIEKRILEKNTPEIPVTTNFMEFFGNADYWKWAEHVDVVSDDSYPEPADPMSTARVAATSDLARSLRHGQPFILMEQTPDTVQWRTYNSVKRPGQFRLWSLARVAHGADGILQFQWRQSPGGAETFHGGMVSHCLSSPVTEEMTELGADLKRLGWVLNTRTGKADIGIIYDYRENWASEALLTPAPFSHTEAVKKWHQIFWEMGYSVDFVRITDALDSYRVVVLPQLAYCPKTLRENLVQAAKNGTQILIAAPFDIVDEDLRARLGGYGSVLPESGVKTIQLCCGTPELGEAWTDTEVDPSINQITSAVGTPTHSQLMPVSFDSEKLLTASSTKPLAGFCWGERLDISEGVNVVATYDDYGASTDLAGLAAITKNSCGKGAIWYLSTDANQRLRRELAEQITQSINLESARSREGLPAGLELCERGSYRFYLNHGEKAVHVELPDGYDLLTGEKVSGTVEIAPRDLVVWSEQL